jgi:hypothetical protein
VQTVESAATKAWSGTGTAGRVALGAVAGSAALGLAGRAALKSGLRPRVLGGRPKLNQQLGELAKQVGRAGASAGALAIELRQLREQADERKRQSPIEVVLSALTSRALPRH